MYFRIRKRSFSSTEPKLANYSRDSPFANNFSQLNRRVDVDHVLFSINCDKWLDDFRKHNVSFSAFFSINFQITSMQRFSELEEDELTEIGVHSALDRKTIMEYIRSQFTSQFLL